MEGKVDAHQPAVHCAGTVHVDCSSVREDVVQLLTVTSSPVSAAGGIFSPSSTHTLVPLPANRGSLSLSWKGTANHP